MMIFDANYVMPSDDDLQSTPISWNGQATVEASATRLRGGDGHGPESPEACIENSDKPFFEQIQ